MTSASMAITINIGTITNAGNSGTVDAGVGDEVGSVVGNGVFVGLAVC